MADQTDNVGVLISGKLRNIGSADRVTLTNGLKVSGGTVDFTGAALSGVATTAIADGTASVQMDGSGNLTETSLVSANITPSGALTLRGGGATQLGDDVGYFAFDGAGALALTGATTVAIAGSGAVSVAGPDNTAAAIALKGGATTRVTLNTTDGADAFEITAASLHLVPVDGSGALTQAGTAGEALAIGDVVSISGTAGKVFQADANHATTERRDPIGVCTLGAAGDTNATRYAIGGIAIVTFDGNVETSDIGKRCYLSDTVKKASLTAPTGAGEIWMLGKVVACPGGAALAQVLIRPQYLSTTA